MLGGRPVVIAGGGVVGLSIAHHLALRGYPEIVLLERDTLASGTTAHGVGGVRQQFSSPINIALSRRAVDAFTTFDERLGAAIGYRQHGFLFLVDDPDAWVVFEGNAERQGVAGVPTQLVPAREVPELFPGIVLDGLIGASYCATDGSAIPAAVAGAFARHARAAGVRILEHTAVTGIERDGDGGVIAVRTDDGRFEAELVIDAAGPWAAEIGRLAGVELPIEPRRRQAMTIDAPDWLTPDLPFTIDYGSGAYVQPRPGEAACGGGDRFAPAGFSNEVDWTLAPMVLETLARRIPRLRGATVKRAWVGIRDMTPDDHAIVGPVAERPGFWVAAGFSGHGFVHSPVVGELLAEWLIDGEPSIDLAPLGLERLRAGDPVTEAAVF